MLTVEEAHLPLTISVPAITDEQYQRLCEKYEDYRVEYSAEGDLIVMPATDPDTGFRNSRITHQLTGWALGAGGIVADSSTGFVLPNGSRRSPDAAWCSSRERANRRPSCPEFVIELLSPSDRGNQIHAKMLEWMDNGAELGWMIDAARQSVTIYRHGQAPETRSGISRIEGEGPVSGFVLDLAAIWHPWA